MIMAVGRKQSSAQADWLEAIARIRAGGYNWQRLERLLESTVANVRARIAGRRAAFAWSGGKDSIALAEVMRLAGLQACVFVMSNLEYPAFLSWVTEHMPDGLEVINTKQDLAWLARNPGMLFPQDSPTAQRWFRIVQHSGQAAYFRKHQLDLLILGRRRADGNHVGPDSIYTNKAGITRYSPLSDWTHEDVLALIERALLPLPPIYSWPRGFQVGTGPWPARQFTGSVENGWREVHQIDPSIVVKAASVIPSAAAFLSGR